VPSEDAGSRSEEAVQVTVKNPRIGKIPVIRDEAAENNALGGRPMTDAERVAESKFDEIEEKFDPDSHESGDHIADVVVEDGAARVVWRCECSENRGCSAA
jgi:hypothetical protein